MDSSAHLELKHKYIMNSKVLTRIFWMKKLPQSFLI